MGEIVETVRIEIPIETIDQTESGVSSASKNIDKLNNAADKAGDSVNRAREKVTKFDEAQEKTMRRLSKWTKEKYEILLEARERITPILRMLGIGLKNITGRTWRVTVRAIDLVTAPVRGIINILKNPVFQAGAVLGVSIGLKDTIDTYKDFEAAMSKVQAISGATGTQMDQLNAKAKEMGATTKFTATETAEAFNYMGMAGWKTKDMLDGIEGILNLAAASGEDLATTSDIVTDALTAFRLSAKDSGHFADVLAQASSNANTNVGMMGESFKYIAPVAGAMKYSIEDVSLALGLMANASIKGSMAGTSLKTALVNMTKPTDKMAAAMDKYGISLTDKGGKMKTLKGVMDNLRTSMGNLSEAEQTAAAGTIFGKEAMAGMLSIINASEKDYRKLIKAVNNADGASREMADTMLDNLEGSLTLLQRALDGTKLSFGERLSPYVRGLAEWLTDSMPEVENALDELMDRVDRGVDSLKGKFKEISLTDQWQTSDIFGKTKILWDEFITEPFSEWWNSTGKAQIAGAVGNFGEVLGSGLHTGIMALLGFDVSDTLNEGASLGKSFAKGFSDGFDFNKISRKLWEGLGNIVKNAGKLLPGGREADLSSLLSAGLLAKMAGPLISLGKGGINIGRALFGSGGAGAAAGAGEAAAGAGTGVAGSLAGSLLGSASAGTGLLGFGANTAIELGAGNLAGGASLSAGALSAVGLGSVAGGVAGAAGLVHGGFDLYTGLTSDDKEKAAAYKKAAAVEIGGTLAGAGAGAATGAAIGAVFGGVGAVPGALIGAGVGAIGSWIAGDKIKEDYEKRAEEAQKQAELAKKAFEVTGLSIDEVKFKNQALNDAMHDTELTAQDLAVMVKEDMAKSMENAFGNVHLSLSDIKSVAEEITFSKSLEGVKQFGTSAEKAQSSLDMLENSVTELKRQNWKVSLGTELDGTGKADYKKSIDDFVERASEYIESNHYQATVALKLISGKKADTGTLDSVYEDMQDKLEKYSDRLSGKTKIFLKDGIIDFDENKELVRLQKKISRITGKLGTAQEEAELDTLRIKYTGSGTALDAESFSQLQEELKTKMQSYQQNYLDAYTVSRKNLNLQLSEKAITQEEYDKKVKNLDKDYSVKIDKMGARVESFNLKTIATEWKDELDGILPDMEGTTREKLSKVIGHALMEKPDAATWSPKDVKEWFGLGKLAKSDGSAFENIFSELVATAMAVPDGTKEKLLKQYKKDLVPTPEEIAGAVDWSSLTYEDMEKMVQSVIPDYGKGGSMGSPGESGCKTLAELWGDNLEKNALNVAGQINAAFKDNVDVSAVSDFMNEFMTNATSVIDTKEAVKQCEEAGMQIGNAVGKGASESVLGTSDMMRSSTQQAINSAVASPFTANAKINITGKYTLLNPFNPGGSAAGEVPKKNAAGGFVSGKELSWLAEEGYGEWVIPTNPARRKRALDLYEQAGHSLGIEYHADGGFAGKERQSSFVFADPDREFGPDRYNEPVNPDFSGNTAKYPVGDTKAAGGDRDGSDVTVHVQLSPEFVITGSGGQGQDEDKTVAVIRRHLREMADELGEELAGRLEDVFSNMPLEEE